MALIFLPKPVTYVPKPFAPPLSGLLYTANVSRVYAFLNTKAPPAKTIGVRLPAAVARLGRPLRNRPTTQLTTRLNSLMGGKTYLGAVRNEEVSIPSAPVTAWCVAYAIPYRVLIVLLSKVVVPTTPLVQHVALRLLMPTSMSEVRAQKGISVRTL